MNITEKYRPTKISDFLGEKEKVEEAEEYIKSKFPVILCGNPGIGKTSAAYIIANDLGYSVSESNMSDSRTTADLKSLQSSLTTQKLIPTIFLLDEIDGIQNQNQLYELIKKTKHPIIMTANDKFRISQKLKRYCKFIEMYPPNAGEIVNRIKKIAKEENITDVSYENISRDVRASINAAFNKGVIQDETPNNFELTNCAFKENMVSNIDPIWLLDSIHEFYHGMDLYDTIKKIRFMVMTGDPIFISTFKRSTSGKSKYPNYLRRT